MTIFLVRGLKTDFINSLIVSNSEKFIFFFVDPFPFLTITFMVFLYSQYLYFIALCLFDSTFYTSISFTHLIDMTCSWHIFGNRFFYRLV